MRAVFFVIFSAIAAVAAAARANPQQDELSRARNEKLLLETAPPVANSRLLLNTNTSSAERDILIAFKKGITWDPNRTLDQWSNTSNNSNYCVWPGIRCDNNSHVKAILLESMALNGTLSPRIADLPFLSSLNLSSNTFYGHIPSQLGKLSLLTQLDLSFNAFYGPIPPSISNCSLLEYLDLNHNSLVGGIPPSWVNLTRLGYLDHSDNMDLGGSVPPNIGLLSNLQFFMAGNTNLSGAIPPSITNCSKLVWFQLNENNLSGTIPPNLGLFSSLQSILLYNNNLSGTIPSALSNCTDLRQIGLSQNQLNGAIPNLAKLVKLQSLQLYYNSLSGPFPESIGNCTNLTSLQLDYNNLSGSIPDSIGLLRSLEWFSASNNPHISGVIPKSLINCSSLQQLNLGSTNLTGAFPASLFEWKSIFRINLKNCRLSGGLSPDFDHLTTLERLDLSYNHFNGKIPSQIGNLSKLQSLILAGNQLTGDIPPELSNCTSLIKLDLSENNLNSSIPASLSGLLDLNELNLQHNNLSGSLPEKLGDMAGLRSLNLAYNKLSGAIPSTFSNFLSLNMQFNLSHNRFSDDIPLFFGEMTMLQTIDLSDNQFGGNIPPELGGCVSLLILDISANKLTGDIPNELGNLKSLQHLDLSQNNLSGGLPQFSALPNLQYLNVSENLLEGPIPNTSVYRNLSAASFLGNSNLCGAVLMKQCPSNTTSNDITGSNAWSTKKKILVIALSSLGGVIVLAAMVFLFLFRRYRVGDQKESIEGGEEDREFANFFEAQFQSWTSQELEAATDGFSGVNILGRGGTSTVYKGLLNPNKAKKEVAIKRMKLVHSNTEEIRRSFFVELRTLSKVRHRNLVQMLGYCWEPSHMFALVLDFMPRGTLDHLLHGVKGDNDMALTWNARLAIAQDVAHALVYLHHECTTPVIHCDLKPSNILLDEDMVAHLNDFGIAHLLNLSNPEGISISTFTFRGTIGYAPPELANALHMSIKSDVFSYGIVMLEMVTKKRPTSNMMEGMCISSWVKSSLVNQKVEDVLDPALVLEIRGTHQYHNDYYTIKEQLVDFIKIALTCTLENPKERPSMKEVREALVEIQRKPSPSMSPFNASIQSLLDNERTKPDPWSYMDLMMKAEETIHTE